MEVYVYIWRYIVLVGEWCEMKWPTCTRHEHTTLLYLYIRVENESMLYKAAAVCAHTTHHHLLTRGQGLIEHVLHFTVVCRHCQYIWNDDTFSICCAHSILNFIWWLLLRSVHPHPRSPPQLPPVNPKQPPSLSIFDSGCVCVVCLIMIHSLFPKAMYHCHLSPL